MLFETHFHTAEVSPCGSVPAAEGVRRYHEAGYAGIVVTDHYTEGFFRSLPADMPWRDKADRYLAGWRAAGAAGEPLGMTVLPGLELRFAGSNNDYLVYGVTPELLYEHPALYAFSPEAFSAFARERGLWWAQAHPFRPGMTRCPARYLDGLEVYNGNPRHDSRNDLAGAYTAEHGLTGVAGSDYHEPEDLSGAGVRFPDKVTDGDSLLRALRSGNFEAVRGRISGGFR